MLPQDLGLGSPLFLDYVRVLVFSETPSGNDGFSSYELGPFQLGPALLTLILFLYFLTQGIRRAVLGWAVSAVTRQGVSLEQGSGRASPHPRRCFQGLPLRSQLVQSPPGAIPYGTEAPRAGTHSGTQLYVPSSRLFLR